MYSKPMVSDCFIKDLMFDKAVLNEIVFNKAIFKTWDCWNIKFLQPDDNHHMLPTHE